MKKLMIAAAAAAMIGGAFADCSDAKQTCLVYDLKVTLKTLGPKAMKCKGTCSDDTVYYLDNVTRTLKGYAWSCDYDCECDGNGSTTLKMALWEPKASLAWWYYNTDGSTVVTWDALQAVRYAKTGKKAAVYFAADAIDGTDNSTICANNSSYQVTSTLKFAAVGGTVAYDKNLADCIIKSISGSVVGGVTPDVRCGKTSTTKKDGSWCTDGSSTTVCCPDYTTVWSCLCNCDPDWCTVDGTDVKYVSALAITGIDAGAVPAVGTWSMKYNASLSKGKTTVAKAIPAYAQK